jgi:hypothetical protein
MVNANFSGGEQMRRFMLGLVIAAATLVPNLATANDQAIARHIMSRLQLEQQRGTLKGFHVDMRVDQGTVWYQGFVSTQEQKDLILRTAQQASKLGVVQVVDDITVRGTEGMQAQQTAFVQEDYAAPPIPQGRNQLQPRMNIPSPQYQGLASNQTVTVPQAGVQGVPMPMNGISQMPVSGDAPNLPGYAWPCYAPHPNYAAVTYPGQYSASTWPYIGPFYPYPQVPLGWRKVTLQWDDGWWWLDFNNCPR